MRYWVVLLILIWPATLVAQSDFQNDVPKQFGAALDKIALPNYDGEMYSLEDYQENKLTVFIFLGHECPICQKYGHKLRTLHKEFQQQNIQLYGIVPLRDVDLKTIEDYASLYDFEFPVLHDKQRILTDLFQATVTPHVFVVDSEGNQVYEGMIDNWFYALGKYRKVITQHYLDDAIAAYLDNKPIPVQKTDPIGCFINMTTYEMEE